MSQRAILTIAISFLLLGGFLLDVNWCGLGFCCWCTTFILLFVSMSIHLNNPKRQRY